jgi:hypothetical protein
MLSAATAVRDTVLGLSPWTPKQARYGLESLRAEEIAEAVGGHISGAALESLQIEVESRGTTDRARVHLHWNAAGRAANLPESVFAKGTSTQASSRAVVSAFGCHTYETRFYQQIYPVVADLTVRPYVARAGSGGRYVIAFEDLRHRGGVRFYNADDEASQVHAEGVIDLLAKLHGRLWRSTRFEGDLRWLETYARRPGYPFMKHLFAFSERKYVRAHPELPDAIKRLTRTYVRNQSRLTGIWEAMPQTLCHGDCHLGNTFGNPDGTAGIYDWQVFHRMNGLRDFAYFMMHSIPTELRRAQEQNLLRRYLAQLADSGAGRDAPGFDDAWEAYRLLIVDGWIAIAFTLAVGGMQPQERMEVTQKRAIATMLDLDLVRKIDQVLA